jgi:hypothetical protein
MSAHITTAAIVEHKLWFGRTDRFGYLKAGCNCGWSTLTSSRASGKQSWQDHVLWMTKPLGLRRHA